MLLLWEHYPKYAEAKPEGTQREIWMRAREDAIISFCESVCAYNPAYPLSNYATKSINEMRLRSFGKMLSQEITHGMTEARGESPDFVQGIGCDGEEQRNLDIPSGPSVPSAPDPGKEFDTIPLLAAVSNFAKLYREAIRAASLQKEQKTETKVQKAQNAYALVSMWFSERLHAALELGAMILNRTETEKALDYDYLDYFLEPDFSNRQNRQLPFLKRAQLKPTVQFRGQALEVSRNAKGWLPAKVPIGYYDETDRVLTDREVSTSRDGFLKLIESFEH